MSAILVRGKALGAFLYDFVIGDDWRVAAGVVALLLGSGVLAHSGLPAWWFPPLAVVSVLGFALRRSIRPPR